MPLTTTRPGRGELTPEGACDGPSVRGARARSDDRDGCVGRGAAASASPRRKICGGGSWIAPRRRGIRVARAVGSAGSRSRCGRLAGRPVRERLGDVRRLDEVGAGERSDRPGDARHARAPSARERKPVDRAREKLRRRVRPPRCLHAKPLRSQRPRALGRGPSAPRGGAASSTARGRGIATAEVEAIEQRPRELLPVRGEPLGACTRTRSPGRRARRTDTCSWSRRAGTAPGRARARRRARPRRRRPRAAAAAPRAPSAGTPAARRGTARRGARATTSPGSRARPAADDRRRRRSVVRRPERRHRDERTSRREQPGDRVDARHLERLVARERRQDARAGAARASSSRYPAAPASSRLCAPAAAISSARRARSWPRTSARSGIATSERCLVGSGSNDGASISPRRYATTSTRWRDRDRLDARERRLRRRLGGADEAAEARPARALGDGERPGDRPDAPVERELADRGVLGEPLGRKLPRRREHRERDRRGRSPIPPCAARPARG